MNRWSRRSVLGLMASAPFLAAAPRAAHAVSAPTGDLETRIQEIIGRPEFAGSHWGIEFHATDTGQPLYSLNAAELFVPGSSFKVFPAGTAFETLGAGHRFRTRVYRTGPLVKGVLKGDLVLVAGGDLLLSGRLRRDGSLALPDPDHSYDLSQGAGPLPGDPLAELRGLARQVAARGVRRVEGRVLVDVSLFREGKESLANGMQNATMSPVMVNDNLVDITVKPGGAAGQPAVLEVSPPNAYLKVLNGVTTVAAGTAARPLTFTGAADAPDGTHSVTITGDVPLGVPKLFRAYYVPAPARFAAALFAGALRDEGVRAEAGLTESPRPSSHYTHGNRLAEHVSPALPDELKVMLKVSSNIHTAMWPYLIGAIAGRDAENAKAAGMALQRELFERAGLDGTPPGASEGTYTPRFFTRFLDHMSRRPYYRAYRRTLPILGRDGTLADVQPDSPAAGHVFAKTGTAVRLQQGPADLSKGLAGFVELPDGRVLTFATFARLRAPSAEGAMELARLAGQALGEIAAASYETSR